MYVVQCQHKIHLYVCTYVCTACSSHAICTVELAVRKFTSPQRSPVLTPG